MPTKSSSNTSLLKPMTRDGAAKLVDQMSGSYPSLNLYDPEVFIDGMVSLLTGYPHWAGQGAVKKAVGSTECKFIPPTQGILKPLLEAEVRVHRYAAEWGEGAERQVLLALAPPKDEPEVRQAFIAKRRAELGPHFGLTQAKPKQKTQAQAQAELIAQVGQEAFDAMPDVGYDWKKLQTPKIGSGE